MTVYKFFITLGQSNSEGYASIVSATDDQMYRWFGTTLTQIVADGYPLLKKAPGVKTWTCTMPFQSASTRKTGATVATGTDATHLAAASGSFTSGDAEKIVVILRGNGPANGAGQVRRITAATTSILTVDPAWTVTPTSTSTWWVGHGLVASAVDANGFGVTAPATSFSADQFNGKIIVCIRGTAAGQMRTIADTTTTEITVTEAFDPIPAVSDAFVIYDSGTLDIGTYQGQWLDRQLYGDTAIVYTTGTEYPNFKSMPISGPSGWALTTACNPSLELGWRLNGRLGEEVYHLPLAIPAAALSPYYGTPANVNFSWFTSAHHNDWAPGSVNEDGSDDLFGVLVNTVFPAIKAALPDPVNDKLDCIGVFTNEGESEATADGRYQFAGQNMAVFRDKLRQAIEDAGLTQKQGKRVPWIIGGMTTDTWTYASEVITQFQDLAEADSYSAFVDASGFSSVIGHFDTQGCADFGAEFFDAWEPVYYMDERRNTPWVSRLTLSSLRTQVKRRYERNNVGNDTPDDQITAAINDAHREILLRLGDGCWYMRRIETMTLTGSFDSTVSTLPPHVARVLRVEHPLRPGRSFPWKGIGYNTSGQLQIMVPALPAGSYSVHFMVQPNDLVGDDDLSPVPDAYRELLVLIACKHLAEMGGNGSMLAYFAQEAEKALIFVKQDCGRYERQRQDAIQASADAFGAFADYERGTGGY